MEALCAVSAAKYEPTPSVRNEKQSFSAFFLFFRLLLLAQCGILMSHCAAGDVLGTQADRAITAHCLWACSRPARLPVTDELAAGAMVRADVCFRGPGMGVYKWWHWLGGRGCFMRSTGRLCELRDTSHRRAFSAFTFYGCIIQYKKGLGCIICHNITWPTFWKGIKCG